MNETSRLNLSRLRPRGARGQGGLSLVELMVALAVIAVGVLPLFSSLSKVRGDGVIHALRVQALQTADSLLEEIRDKRWDEATVDEFAYLASPSAIGPDAESPAEFDDVDDYHGYEETVGTIRLSVAVDYVSVVDGSELQPSAFPTDYKRVRVSAAWGANVPRQVSVETILANGVGR